MPLFSKKKKLDNDPLDNGYTKLGPDEKSKAIIYINTAAEKTDKPHDNKAIRWYLATVSEGGKFEAPPENPTSFRLRAVKLSEDSYGKPITANGSWGGIKTKTYTITDEEVNPINFEFSKIDEYNSRGSAAPGPLQAPGHVEGQKDIHGNPVPLKAPQPPPKGGARTRYRMTKRNKSKKSSTRKKKTRVPKQAVRNIYKRHPPIKYRKVKP